MPGGARPTPGPNRHERFDVEGTFIRLAPLAPPMLSRRRVVGLLATVALLAASDTAAAHVDYVVDTPAEAADAISFFVQAVATPLGALLFGGGGLLAALALVGYVVVRPFATDMAAFRAAMVEYDDYLPWLLRLSVGLPLVGAGFAGYFFSPSVAIQVRLLQVGLGFLLLFGLATRAVAVVGLGVYLVGLAIYPELLLAIEYVGAFTAIAMLGPGRPSADHVLERVASTEGTLYGRVDPVHRLATRLRERLAPYERYATTVVRLTLGVGFVYLGLSQKLLEPGMALAVVEKYGLTAVVPVPAEMWVVGAGLAEMAVGALLLVGLLTRGAAMVAFVLFTTTLLGLPDDPVLAHVSLFGLASFLLVTGSGPVSVDRWLLGAREGTARGALLGARDGGRERGTPPADD